MRAGDADWTTWFERHGAALALFARQWAPTHADAEDIVQEAFVRFWKSRPEAADPTAYLYACVRNAALDWLRSRGRRQRRDQNAARATAPHAEPVFERDLENAELRSEVEALLRALPEEQRQVMVMKLWGELTFAQIGEALDISPNTAASRYRYALDSLRRRIPEGPR